MWSKHLLRVNQNINWSHCFLKCYLSILPGFGSLSDVIKTRPDWINSPLTLRLPRLCQAKEPPSAIHKHTAVAPSLRHGKKRQAIIDETFWTESSRGVSVVGSDTAGWQMWTPSKICLVFVWIYLRYITIIIIRNGTNMITKAWWC